MTRYHVAPLFACLALLAMSQPAQAVLAFNTDVTPDAIFGSGNTNGGWSVSTNSGVELGLRAKLRYPTPQNVFPYTGTVPIGTGMVPYGRYTFGTGSAPGLPERPIWNFEFSINTDIDGTTGWNLDDLTYVLAFDTTDMGGTIAFDPINQPYFDHSIGDNSTGNGSGVEAVDPIEYLTLIGDNNVAQQSWNVDFFTDSFDPEALGEYRVTLSAFQGSTFIGQAAILVQVVPEPSALLWFGLIGTGFVSRSRRNR